MRAEHFCIPDSDCQMSQTVHLCISQRDAGVEPCKDFGGIEPILVDTFAHLTVNLACIIAHNVLNMTIQLDVDVGDAFPSSLWICSCYSILETMPSHRF